VSSNPKSIDRRTSTVNLLQPESEREKDNECTSDYTNSANKKGPNDYYPAWSRNQKIKQTTEKKSATEKTNRQGK
jgi:hypothetical protein